MESKQQLNIIFFGTPDFSVTILNHMKKAGLSPTTIVTAPDRKVGRKQVLTAPPVAVWAKHEGIELLQPEHPSDIYNVLKEKEADLFVVAAYGYIIKQNILDLPKYGTLNVHTSLLPRYRGACPIESAILHGDTETGSTIMLMDAKMDHGPIITQELINLDEDTNREELFDTLSDHGGDLLVRTIEPWVAGDISPQEQDHEAASYCYKITKADGDISNDDDATRYRKYLAYYGWPGVFYFNEDGKRIKVTQARYENNRFVIERIIPEGKTEMDYIKNSS
jgi:methionyl-tRNA formyltransferase